MLLLHLLFAWNCALVCYVTLNSAREMWSYRQRKTAGCCQVFLIELYSAHKSVIALAGITDAVPWAFHCSFVLIACILKCTSVILTSICWKQMEAVSVLLPKIPCRKSCC